MRSGLCRRSVRISKSPVTSTATRVTSESDQCRRAVTVLKPVCEACAASIVDDIASVAISLISPFSSRYVTHCSVGFHHCLYRRRRIRIARRRLRFPSDGGGRLLSRRSLLDMLRDRLHVVPGLAIWGHSAVLGDGAL